MGKGVEVMKIVILGGFLGAGKTTVLMQFAAYLVRTDTSGKETPVVILENEISSAGVDNQLLSKANFTVENIFDGCVCCSSSGLLCNNVRDIKKQYDPEWLILEATGMAYPDNIRESLKNDAGMDASILALADAKRWSRTLRAMAPFVKSQLKDAAVILLNKVDLVKEEDVPAIKKEIEGFNSTATIYPIIAIDPIEDRFWEEIIEILKKEC